MNVLNANVKFKNVLQSLDLSKVKYIVVHHIEADTATVEDINNWHLANGWSGIGYNEYIRKDGTVYICRGDNVGAHVLNYNEVSYGIALEGNYQINGNIPDLQYKSLLERLRYHQNRIKNTTVVPHRQLCKTECPGNAFPWNGLIQDLIKKDYKQILHELSSNPDEWITYIDSHKNSNDISKYLAALIEKIYYK